MKKYFYGLVLVSITTSITAQTDHRLYEIIEAISPSRIEKDVKTLADFGTRHTLSDTV